MNPNIGISEQHLAAISQVLSRIFADEFVLYTKTRNAHWNLEGPDFHSMHIMFESQYHELAEIIDKVAARIRMLGHYTPATLKQFLELTHLAEETRDKNDSREFIKELWADHKIIAINIRTQMNRLTAQLKDADASDYLTDLIKHHEKIARILRSQLI
jgi:starvation-inducible DNA-binding protein